MSALIFSPKSLNDFYCFNWMNHIDDDISIDLSKAISEVRWAILPSKTDKYDEQVAFSAVASGINQRILNGETLFIQIRPYKMDEPEYYSQAFVVNKLLTFARSLHNVDIIALKPELVYGNAYEYNQTYIKGDDVTLLTGSDAEIRDALQVRLENDIADLSKYNEIVRIGDIQGCLSNLEKALPHGIKDSKFYVFLGDYIDRGPDSLGVLKWLKKNCFKNNKLKENVVLLMGNHERHLITWTLGMEPTSNSFMRTTFPQIEDNKHRELIDLILSSLKASFIYKYKGHTTICCHGGLEQDIPRYPFNILGQDERDKSHWLSWSIGGLHNMWQMSDKELYGGFLNKGRNIGEQFVDNMMTYYGKDDRVINLEMVYGHFHIRGTELSWENKEYNLRSICHENDVDRGGKLVVSYDRGNEFEIKEF